MVTEEEWMGEGRVEAGEGMVGWGKGNCDYDIK